MLLMHLNFKEQLKNEFDYDWEELIDVFKLERKKMEQYIYIKYNDQWIPEHRLKIEFFLQQPLTNNDLIHHIDLNKENNNIHNLLIVDINQHTNLHGQLRRMGHNLIKLFLKNNLIIYNDLYEKYI